MATLKLNKPAGTPPKKNADGERRSPVRGKGVSRPRQSLEAAQADRQERQAAFEQRRASEAAGRPPQREVRDPRDQRETRGPRPDQRGAPPARPRSAAPYPRDEAPRFEERRPPRRNDGPGQFHEQPREQPRRDGPAPEPRRDQRRATAGPRPFAEQRPPQRPMPRPRERRDDDDDVDPSAEGERLSKRMGVLGMASRREADEWIGAGWVRVNGKMAVLGQRVGPDVKIEIDPAAHKEQAKQVTILLNKPIGYVSGQAEDGYEPAVVLVKSTSHWADDPSGTKYHLGHARGLAPAGRLDIDSTGLLVLTQDGRVAKLLIGEDSKIEKEYLVRVEYAGEGAPMQKFPAQDLALLNHGLELDDVQLKPAKVSWINDDQLRFVLREGRKRQIRRMCELVGLKVVGLKRVRIGRINLGHLPVGQWRYLSPWERFD